MNTDHSFVAAGRAAQHCAELLRRAAEPEELLPQFARQAERLAKSLAPSLAPLGLGGEIAVAAGQPRLLSETELVGEIGPLAANCLISLGGPGRSLVAIVEGATVLSLVDRAFGGRGDAPAVLPREFPLSAGLLIDRLKGAVAEALASTFCEGRADAVRALRHESRYAELAPFPATARLVAIELEVAEEGRPAWRLRLVLPLASLPKFVTGESVERMPGAADPAAAPFADVPLVLRALLVDMTVPLSAVSALEPGALLPISVARAVPLLIGEATIARGVVGAEDDRLALQLTRIA